ncbi:MAG: flagellar filament capping protein FliD [Erythrobacter sp.]
MTNSGSSIISALGAGSGIDFTKLASDLSVATFAAQRQAITNRTAALEARISAAASLRNMVTSLASAVGSRVRSGDLAPRANLANPGLANVTFTPGVTPRGSYTLEVTQLAASQRLVMPPLAHAGDPVGEGSLTIRFGTIDGTTFTEGSAAALAITVAAGESLATLAGRINSTSGGMLSAQVLNGANGAQLVLTGSEGAANSFVIEAAGTGALASLAWTPAAPGSVQRPGIARDALFQLNSVEMRSATNAVTGLPEGLGLQLAATNPGAPAALTFSTDNGAVSRLMEDFVSALNEVVGEVKTLGNPLGGELGNDPGLRALRNALSGLASEVVMPGAAAGEPRTLADLGVALNRDGTFRLDQARLGQALNDNPQAVAAMFTTGPSGVFATIDRMARSVTRVGDPGTLGGSIARFQRQLQSNGTRSERIAEQQEALRERLTRSFTASERRVGASQATLAFLQQQIDIWSAPRR